MDIDLILKVFLLMIFFGSIFVFPAFVVIKEIKRKRYYTKTLENLEYREKVFNFLNTDGREAHFYDTTGLFETLYVKVENKSREYIFVLYKKGYEETPDTPYGIQSPKQAVWFLYRQRKQDFKKKDII